MNNPNDQWDEGDSYEFFMGRWSSLMAREFLRWLNPPLGSNWLDVGCGTGALSGSIVQICSPEFLSCIDPSENFIKKLKSRISIKGELIVCSAEDLPFENECFDVIVSGLALNFFPGIKRALSEMKRVSKKNGIVAAYVWDYSGRMDFLRYFWDAAYQINPESKILDEGIRFPICKPDNLIMAFQEDGFKEIESSFLDIDTIFKDFEDFWDPFLGGQGPAPGYLSSLDNEFQEELKNKIKERINYEPDGSIKLIGRAIAIRGTNK